MTLDTKKMKRKKKTPSMTKRIRDVKRLLAKVRKKLEHACSRYNGIVFHEDQHVCRILWMISYVR